MIPIYEQGKGRGIGHNLASFLDRFDKICQEHIKNNGAKAFAFIFYNFTDEDLRRILKDQGTFAKLDRLSGTNLSLFYLHSGGRETVRRFNERFLKELGVIENAAPPCVVFFKLKKEHIEDVAIAALDSADLLHGFQELYDVIERYIQSDVNQTAHGLHSLKWLKSGAGFIALEVFRVILRNGLNLLF
ncbi:MAG: hypothetical protein RQ760_06795 [Sedimentisphaerales bacterium]|nr:hypothetical protein [Sedimentisphaerales bacterium]